MKLKKSWVCYKADMELNEDDVILVRSDDKTVFIGRVVSDGSPEVIVDFDIGMNMEMCAFWHKKDILMVLR